MIWTELYRPKTLKDFIGNRNIVKVSKKWLEGWWEGKAILPILILHGRSGIGKTTLSHCLGAEYDCSISELNASDERNVKNMRRAIQITGVSGLHTKHRLTILDEADHMSKASQKLLVSKVKLIKQPVRFLKCSLNRLRDVRLQRGDQWASLDKFLRFFYPPATIENGGKHGDANDGGFHKIANSHNIFLTSGNYQFSDQAVDHRYQKREAGSTEYVGYLDKRDVGVLAVSQEPPEKPA